MPCLAYIGDWAFFKGICYEIRTIAFLDAYGVLAGRMNRAVRRVESCDCGRRNKCRTLIYSIRRGGCYAFDLDA